MFPCVFQKSSILLDKTFKGYVILARISFPTKRQSHSYETGLDLERSKVKKRRAMHKDVKNRKKSTSN